MANKQWYGIDVKRLYAGMLKFYLSESHIYFEPSEMGEMIHFECLMTEYQSDRVDSFLEFIRKGLEKNG